MADMLLEPVGDRSAWTCADLAGDQDWTHRWTDAELAELDGALDRVLARGLKATEFGRDDFPLPGLAARIAGLTTEIEDGRGFAVIRGLPVDAYDETALRALYWGIGSHFGAPISQNSKGHLVAEVTDRGNDYTRMNARGYVSNAELFPHVDTSDMTVLLCCQPAKEGGVSMVASSMAVYNEILAHHAEYLDILYRGFHHDLRGEGRTARIDEVTDHRIPVFSYYEGRLSCGFNCKIIESAAKKMGTPLDTREREALDLVRTLAERDDLCHRFDLAKGDVELINNYTTLHSRTQFTDFPEPERKRRLLRLWVNFYQGRALAPDFSNRYNTGPRGGVAVGDGARYVI